MFTARNRKSKAEIINPVFTDADLSNNLSLIRLSIFSFTDFFDWWYIQMPLRYLLSLQRVSVVADDRLSITLLLRNFFVPWHRDYTLVGLFMGISLKVIYLPIAILIYLGVVLGYTLFLISWILLPMVAIILIFFTPFIKSSAG